MTMKQKYHIIRSRCIPMNRENIDTDQSFRRVFSKKPPAMKHFSAVISSTISGMMLTGTRSAVLF